MTKFFAHFSLPVGILMIIVASVMSVYYGQSGILFASAVGMCGLVTLWSSFVGDTTIGLFTNDGLFDPRRDIWAHVLALCVLVFAGVQLGSFQGVQRWVFIAILAITAVTFVAASIGVLIKLANSHNSQMSN